MLEDEDAACLGIDIHSPLLIRRCKSGCTADKAFIAEVEMQGIIRLQNGAAGFFRSVRGITVP